MLGSYTDSQDGAVAASNAIGLPLLFLGDLHLAFPTARLVRTAREPLAADLLRARGCGPRPIRVRRRPRSPASIPRSRTSGFSPPSRSSRSRSVRGRSRGRTDPIAPRRSRGPSLASRTNRFTRGTRIDGNQYALRPPHGAGRRYGVLRQRRGRRRRPPPARTTPISGCANSSASPRNPSTHRLTPIRISSFERRCGVGHQRFRLSRLSDALGISRERVNWAGTKDKYAVTTQLFSVYGADPRSCPRSTGSTSRFWGGPAETSSSATSRATRSNSWSPIPSGPKTPKRSPTSWGVRRARGRR